MLKTVIGTICMTLTASVLPAVTTVYVVTPANPVPSVTLAAEELATYLPQVSDVAVERVAAEQFAPATHRPAIVIGQAPQGAQAPVERDAYRILSADGSLWLFGHDQAGETFGSASKGSLYAAYDYLTSAYGVRWILPGEDGVALPAEKRPLVIDGLDRQQRPAFQQRVLNNGINPKYEPQVFQALGLSEKQLNAAKRDLNVWMLRNRLSSYRIAEAGHAFGDWWEKYHQEHPEWFAQHRNGQRVLHGKPGRVKLCDSNPEVVKMAVQRGLERIANNPHSISISGSPNDSALSNYCMCDNCRALDPQDGPKLELNDITGPFEYVSLSDRYVTFWNRMAEELGKTRPDLRVAGYAYYSTSTPPLRTQVNPRVLIGFVQLASAYWDRTSWEAEREKFKGWAAKGGEYYWRPNSLLISNGIPSNYLKRFADDLRLIHQNNTSFLFYDSLVPNWGTEGHIFYVAAQLMWDPNQPVEQLVDDYLAAAYGPGAAAVREYLAELEKLTDRLFESKLVDGNLWRYSGEYGAANIYDDAAVERLASAIEKAAQAVSGSPVHARRVQLLKEGLDYTRLQLAAYRQLYLAPLPLNFASGPLAEALAARDAWLKQNAASLAIYTPSVARLAQSLQPNIEKIRSRLPVTELLGE